MVYRKPVVSSLSVLSGMILLFGFLTSGGFIYLYFFALLFACVSFLREPLTRKEWLHEGIAFIFWCSLIYLVQHLVYTV
ncbi:hypothetical protein ADM98_10180 [Exiguobacterium sp. BMC-KP]|uniref:hypothetical protein n=1 Tax=Exiguobacterium sp. BMC-KP TaxID=1684312 RepID=UPI0006AA22BD|nr:hypothetical protein [Exiguobacterium sp. BMC-KP]KOP29252.1 hypothetical protein ADM98_10180 [Exiguobacterium sp. BMC-KP]